MVVRKKLIDMTKMWCLWGVCGFFFVNIAMFLLSSLRLGKLIEARI